MSNLVRIHQAGEQEDGIVHNSTFDEGESNGDGEFDAAELVVALQGGQYVKAGGFAAAIDRLVAQ